MAFKLHQALTRPCVRGFIFKECLHFGNKGYVQSSLNAESSRQTFYNLPLSMAALNINSIRTPPHLEPSKVKIPPCGIPSRIMELPQTKTNIAYEDSLPTQPLEDPSPSPPIEKQAVTLIRIRRKKMKKHKLRKLRKKMKFEWAKVRQRRELKKEKEFQAHLLENIRLAQSFDPAKYAAEKIARSKEVELPKFWKGVSYPEHVIKELIKEQEIKEKAKIADEKRKASMSPYVKDYLENLPK